MVGVAELRMRSSAILIFCYPIMSMYSLPQCSLSLCSGLRLAFCGDSPCIVRAEARGQRQSTACAVLLMCRVAAIGVILLLVLFLGRLRLPLFSSSRRRWGLLVKRTLGTSVPTFFLLVISLFQLDYDYLGFVGFVDYAYLDWGAGGGEGGWT